MNLTVVIVNYGTARHVLKNLEALVPELRKLGDNARCWIVDNCSTDDSVSIITKAIDKNNYSDCVDLIPFPLNGGFGAGNNVAIRKALSLDTPPDYFYLLNPDAIVHPGTLKKLATYLKRHENVGVVGGPLYDTDGKLECGAFRLPTLTSTIEENLGIGLISRLMNNHRVSISPPPAEPTVVGWIGGASMMVSRAAFEKAGLFDEGYFLYFEELDLCKHINDSGMEVHYLPDAGVIHDSGASTGIHKANVRLPEYWHFSRSRYLRKTFGESGLRHHNIATVIAGSIGRIYGFLRLRRPSKSHYLRDIIKYNFGKNTESPIKIDVPIKTAELPTNDNALIARRPHYRKADDRIYFMASRNPAKSLSREELLLWNALEQEKTFGDIKKLLGEEILPALSTFIEMGICDAFDPQTETDRKKILVFEPHSDDAALSIGATMWQLRNQNNFTLVTLGSTSNYTSYFSATYGPLKVDEVTNIRNRENEIFTRYMNGHYVPADEKEATLRYEDGDWSHEFLKKHRISVAAFNNHFGTNSERQCWQSVISKMINKFPADEIWIPMGVGTHSDHGITRDACLAALKDAQNTDILFYQDVPYDGEFWEHKLKIVETLEHNGAVLEHIPVEISSTLPDKLRLLNIYGSQFKLKAILQNVLRSAKPKYARGFYEHFWKIHKFPEPLTPAPLFCDSAYVELISAKTQKWFKRNKTAEKIRLLLLMPSGQWKTHIDYLMDQFPDADFEVVCSPSSEAELTRYQHPRISYSVLDAGGKAWGKLMLRLMVSPGMPTLFIAGDKRYEVAQKIARLWLQHDTMVSRTLEALILASRSEA
ncbi:MAG: glycosyltransferase [Alphaproteobacteria bacterium]|nr:glycosyltransferase [Alphaproteobacteria bacterium]HPF47056.1 glycosyltransferase family 2 protein [Emcibacteraceae bacterium]